VGERYAAKQIIPVYIRFGIIGKMDFISAARKIIKEFITKTQLIQLYNDIFDDTDLSTDEKITELLHMAFGLHHDEVMNALKKEMDMELYKNLDDDAYDIIRNFDARQARKAEEKRKKEAECNIKEDELPILGNPTISTEDNSEISMYKWEDGRVVSVVESDDGDTIEGNLKTYSDKFAENTAVTGKYYREVLVDATEDQININLVYLGKGSGICTLGVASVLYAVLDQASMIGWFPSKGHVHIMSLNGCRAFNCYNRAFKLNGFELDPDTETNQHDIVHEYANRGYGNDVEDGEFTYDLYYVSTKQKQKEIKYKQHKKGVFRQFVCDSCIHNLSEK
jgi:hypothetical protein